MKIETDTINNVHKVNAEWAVISKAIYMYTVPYKYIPASITV